MDTTSLHVNAADILRLIQAHLTECGLHQACRALRLESGVGAAGSSHSNWKMWATRGEWGLILASLTALDSKTCRIPSRLVSEVQEMAILELAEAGDLQLAYATLRLVADDMNKAEADEEKPNSTLHIPRARQTEQRLAALMSSRANQSNGGGSLPPEFFGELGKQARREAIGAALMDVVPVVPPSRLSTLLGQSIKWQAHTGELPMTRDQWQGEGDDNTPRRKRRRFDIVLGESSISKTVNDTSADIEDELAEPIPSKQFSSISFGKKATAECAIFLQDGSGLVTGSSDGLLEIWDPNAKYKELRMDLPYQQKEELLGHESPIMSVSVSNDGTMLASGDTHGEVKVWRVDSGTCLRSISAHVGYVVAAVSFSNNGSRVLTASHDTTCREFGLRNARVLKEFRGHQSFVNDCRYVLADELDSLRVVTSSADGTARVWDGNTAELLFSMKPISIGRTVSQPGESIVRKVVAMDGESPNLHTIIPMHSPPRSMIIVPRGKAGFHVSNNGLVIQTFKLERGSADAVFVAATVSPSNRWFYAVLDEGTCHVFDVLTGRFETEISQIFGDKKELSTVVPEATDVLHHPTKGIVATFSRDKSQKRGKLVLWK